MPLSRQLLRAATAASLLLPLAAPQRAQLVPSPASVPSGFANSAHTENIDLGDVDLDGDWDAVMANGGDDGNDQNRIWLNLGGAQGGELGKFADRTAQLFPAIADQSRDIEFVDFDGDSDLDVFISNTAQQENQSNRWWTNQGLIQGGQLGHYVDETVVRWVGLAEPGSSIAAPLLMPKVGALPGGFIDFSCDSDFADFDNDGDLDLFQASYGISFSALVPSRVFLNDGRGFYSEFNPSGKQLFNATLIQGEPAVFAEGVFRANTTDTTGAEADVCTNGLDIDLADIDGDLDLDVLHGDRDSLPRLFANRLEEKGGTPADLGFRDVSHAVLPGPTWAVGGGNYEQELGDIDGDGDLDLYGLNWGSNAGLDRMFRNAGGTFGDLATLPGSEPDDNEGDFLDFDNDGALDLYVAAYSTGDRLYRNVDTGSGPPQMILVGTFLLPGSTNALDADAADVDGDGDYDVMGAADLLEPNYLLLNTTNVPDVHAPKLERLEAAADRTAGIVPGVVRVQVYDNAPYYVTWYDATVLEVAVDGCSLGALPMRSSGGQIFRGELPGNLVGAVTYRARAEDEYGNAGTTPILAYAAADLPGGSSATFGADSDAGAPQLRALSVAFPGERLWVGADGMTPGHLWFLTWRQLALPAPVALPGLGLANVGGAELFLFSGTVDAAGCGVQALAIPSTAPAVSTYFQMFEYPGDGPDLFDSSLGLRVDVRP